MAKTIVGSFDSFEEAQDVVRDLQQHGFSRDDISVIANNATGKYSSLSAGVGQVRADTTRECPKQAQTRRPARRQVACLAARPDSWWA